MASRIPLLRLITLVDPNADNLTRCTEGNVKRDGETCAGRGAEVRREPAQKGWDTGEGTAGCNDQTAVAVLKLQWLELCPGI